MEPEGRAAATAVAATAAAGERVALSLAAAAALSGPGGLGIAGLYEEVFPDGVLGGWDADEGEVRMSGSASIAPERDSSCSDGGCSTPADECRWREELWAEGGSGQHEVWLSAQVCMYPSALLTPVYRV